MKKSVLRWCHYVSNYLVLILLTGPCVFQISLSTNVDDRMKCLEDLLKKMNLPDMISIDHIFSGPAGNRKLSSLCIVEFASRSIREIDLNKFEEKPLKEHWNIGITAETRTWKMPSEFRDALALAITPCSWRRETTSFEAAVWTQYGNHSSPSNFQSFNFLLGRYI